MAKHNRNSTDDSETPLERRLARLIAVSDDLAVEREQRREVIVEGAERDGLDRRTAEEAYDIAVEESLPPAAGLALVRLGISVMPSNGGADVETSEPAEPEWIDEPPGPEEAARERRLRETFRRLRSFMDEAPHPRQATSAFAREPDLEIFDY